LIKQKGNPAGQRHHEEEIIVFRANNGIYKRSEFLSTDASKSENLPEKKYGLSHKSFDYAKGSPAGRCHQVYKSYEKHPTLFVDQQKGSLAMTSTCHLYYCYVIPKAISQTRHRYGTSGIIDQE